MKAIRLARGITFDAFVEETGLGRGYISELERGLVVPSLDAIERIAAAMGIEVRELFPQER